MCDHVVTKGVMPLEKAEETKEKIMEEALHEFGSKGYDKASTNLIHSRAKVSKGLIFKIFKTKSDLYYLVFKKAIDDMIQCVGELHYSDAEDVFAKIVKVTAWKLDYANKNKDAVAVMMEAITKPPKGLEEKIARHYKDLTVLSINQFFIDIPMEKIRDEYTKEDVIRNIMIGVAGLTETYVKGDLSVEYMQTIKDESLGFLKILMRGMEK